MNITPENALSYQHAEWLQHPVTKQMLSIMDKQKQHIINSGCSSAGVQGIDPFWFQLQFSNVKTIDVIKNWITNTEQFIQQLNKQ